MQPAENVLVLDGNKASTGNVVRGQLCYIVTKNIAIEMCAEN